MRTFKLELGLDMKAVVPDAWIEHMRGIAADPEQATKFLSLIHI